MAEQSDSKSKETYAVEVGLVGGEKLDLAFGSKAARYSFAKRMSKVGPRNGLTVTVLTKAKSADLMNPQDLDSGCLNFEGYIADYTYLRLL